MKKFSLFRPFRKVLVLYRQGYCFYRFRFGKCIEKQVSREHPSSILSKSIDLLIACPLQDIHFEQTPPLKHFDRSSFLFHTLSHRFKTTKWIAARWLTSRSLTGFRFSDIPENHLKEFRGICGAFLGELGRFSLFETQEGCLLAPVKSGQLYQIYIKENRIYFARLVFLADFNVTPDLDVLKRHLERYYQANLQILKIKWWGPHAPPDIDVHEEGDFEESVIQNYIRYSQPFLRFRLDLTPKIFQWPELRQKLKTAGPVAGAVLLFFSLSNSYRIFEIEEQHGKLQQAFENQEKIYQDLMRNRSSPEDDARYKLQKECVECLNFLIPLTRLPWDQLEKISHHVKKDIRCHELIWLRGQIQFHLMDHTFELHPHVFEKQLMSQSLVIAVTGSYGSSLKNFDRLLKKDLGQGVEVKSWNHTDFSRSVNGRNPDGKSAESIISHLIQVTCKS